MQVGQVGAKSFAVCVLACVSSACSGGASRSIASAELGSADAAAPDAPSDPCAGGDPRFVFYAIGDSFFPVPACRALLDAEDAGLVAAGAPAPVWTSPLNGDQLNGENWVTFRWSSPLLADAGPSSIAVDGYVVEFRQGNRELLRVMLEGTAWPVDLPSWTLLKSVTGSVEATVVQVRLRGQSLDPETPPVSGELITFTISM